MRVAPSIIYTIFVGLRKWFSDKRQTIFAQKRAPGRLPRLATQLFCNNGKTIATKVGKFSNKTRPSHDAGVYGIIIFCSIYDNINFAIISCPVLFGCKLSAEYVDAIVAFEKSNSLLLMSSTGIE